MLRLALASTLGAILLGLAAPAVAQVLEIDELSALTFRPAPGTHRYLSIDGVDIGRRSDLPIELVADYAFRPLYVSTFCGTPGVECEEDLDHVAVAEHVLAFHLGTALPIGRRIELGLSLPVVHASGEGWTFVDDNGPRRVAGGSATGIGDPLLSVRARLFGGAEQGLGLATVAYGALPLGQLTMDARYVGDDHPRVGGHLVAEALDDRVRGAVVLGGEYRAPRGLTSQEVGPMLTYGGAVEWSATDLVAVLGEAQGSVGLGGATPQLELRAAGRLGLGAFELTAGTGVGIVRGPGVPWLRLFAGVRWTPVPEQDRDGDDVPDASDRCPDDAEDEDGFLDEDGCPDEDDDGDGIPDDGDRCPNDAEDPDDHQDGDGCPDRDDDGDGVPDGYDSCREEPEDRDGDRDDDGCPDTDRDRDGVNDDTDRCPDEPEDTDGLADEDGCPEADADGDGVPDVEDPCADIPGTDCHTDTDEDGTPDIQDRCPRVPDPECIADTDDDGIADVEDVCPRTPGTDCLGEIPSPPSDDAGAPPPPGAPDAGTPPPPGDDGIDWTPP